MTQDQVARALGKPQSYVSKYENGERTLNFIEVIDVIEALEFDPVTKISKLISGK